MLLYVRQRAVVSIPVLDSGVYYQDGIYCLSWQYSEWLICYYCASGRLCQYGCSLISSTRKRNILPVWYILPTYLYMDSYSGLFGMIGQAFISAIVRVVIPL